MIIRMSFCKCSLWIQFQAKRSTNPNFWVWISSAGVGVFHVSGGVQKVRYAHQNPAKMDFRELLNLVIAFFFSLP